MLHRRKALTDFEVKYYISQLVDALLYLYESKVIHRDLKLANIFLDKQMRIKVGDFGLSTKLKKIEMIVVIQ
jgi:polo-like kinase 1